MRMITKNTIFKKIKICICLTIILFVSIILASAINDSDGIDILNMLPNILGILFSGILSSLAIILAILSTRELSVISSLNNGFEKYTNFLKNAKCDIKVVFLCTVFSIFFSVLTKIRVAHLAALFLKSNLFVFSLHIKIQLLLIFGFVTLFLSLSSILDLIESIFTLSRLRYEASKKQDNEQVQKAENKYSSH